VEEMREEVSWEVSVSTLAMPVVGMVALAPMLVVLSCGGLVLFADMY
jgi:hypothetical protein